MGRSGYTDDFDDILELGRYRSDAFLRRTYCPTCWTTMREPKRELRLGAGDDND